MLNLSCLLLCLISPVIDEQDNPEYKLWSKYKAGTTVTMTSVTDSQGQKMEMVTTTTLKSIDAKQLVLETKGSMVIAGQKIDQPAQERPVPAKIPKVDIPVEKEDKESPKPKIEEGKEDVSVGDKKLSCKWIKSTIETNGMKVESKSWTCDDIPGGMVKSETVTSGEAATKMSMVVTSYEVK